MTLILTALNDRYAVQLSDRRLTSNGMMVDDEANKAIAVQAPDARFSVAFTGLARAGSFATRDWLMEAIKDAASVYTTAPQLVDQVAIIATKTFTENRAIPGVADRNRRLDIVFAGFGYLLDPPIAWHAQISNLQPDGSLGDFRTDFHLEHRPNKRPPTLLYTGGYDVAWNKEDERIIRRAVAKAHAGADMASVLHSRAVKIADRPASKSMIGKQFDSIIIDRDGGTTTLAYESDVVKSEARFAATISITGAGQVTMTKDSFIRTEGTASPVAVPRVHRNAPCPCGSGKRYRDCHRK